MRLYALKANFSANRKMTKLGVALMIGAVIAALALGLFAKLIWFLIPLAFLLGLGLAIGGAVQAKSIGSGNGRYLP